MAFSGVYPLHSIRYLSWENTKWNTELLINNKWHLYDIYKACLIVNELNNFCNFRDVLKFAKLKIREKSFHKLKTTGILNTLLYNWHLCRVHSYYTIHSFLTCCWLVTTSIYLFFFSVPCCGTKSSLCRGGGFVHRLNKKQLEFAVSLSNRWSLVLCIHKYPFSQKKILSRSREIHPRPHIAKLSSCENTVPIV